MNTDNELLARYAEDGSEQAFRELVERHLGVVHAAALRESRGDSGLAEDISQAVFTELARGAAKLASHPAIAGWLYTCVRRTAANVRRSEDRRHRREQEALTMNETLQPERADQLWQQMRPVLDDVMHELDEKDRAAIVLRYFQGRSLKEVGSAIGVSENAARMRVERTLEKLNGLLAKRGVKSTTSALAVALLAGAAVTTPRAALASSIAAHAMAKAAAGAGVAAGAAGLRPAFRGKMAVAVAVAVGMAGFFLWRSLYGNPTQSAAQATAPSVKSIGSDDGIVKPVAVQETTKPKPSAAPHMTLRLVDAESEQPLAAAKLHLFYAFEDGRGKVVHAATDTNGQAEVDTPQAPYRDLNLFVTAAGHVPKVTTFGIRRAMPAQYTIKMEVGLTVSGLAVDDAGQPIAGAEISFYAGGIDFSVADNTEFGPDAKSLTDAFGRWTCDMIPEGRKIVVEATHPNFAGASITIDPASADAKGNVIKMSRGFSVAGAVDDFEGRAVAGASVRQVRLNDENERSGATDDTGSFRLTRLNAGELTVCASANGFAPQVKTMQISSNLEGLHFTLYPGQLLRGRITDENGNPIANAFVETTRGPIDKVHWSTNTDANGQFEWASAPQEALVYSVLAEGFDYVYAKELKADGALHEIKLTHHGEAQDGVQIAGTVVDAQSQEPLKAFKVLLVDHDAEWAYPPIFVTEGRDGKWAMPLDPNSSHPGYQIQIEADGYLPAATATLQSKDGSQTLPLALQRGEGPSGVALLPDGEPAVDATVLLCTSLVGVAFDASGKVETGLNTTTYRARADKAGRFSVKPAVGGEALIFVHDEGFADVSLADFSPGGSVTLQPWGRIEGKLMLEGHPMANTRVNATQKTRRYDETGRSYNHLDYRLETTTDVDGNFSFNKVPPGQCEVYQRGQSHDILAAVKAGETTQVVLGGAGRRVIGQVAMAGAPEPMDWKTAQIRLVLHSGKEPGAQPKREAFTSAEAYITAEERFFERVEAQQRYSAVCQEDGTFRASDVPAGNYLLSIRVFDSKRNSPAPEPDLPRGRPIVGQLSRDVVVPDGPAENPVDLGVLELARP